MANYLMGIDLGTSGVKAAIYADNGAVIASAAETYPLYHPQQGWAEQNPDDWWRATCAAIHKCAQLAEIDSANHLAGIALSGQMHGAVLLDENARPLRPCIIWADQRCQDECDEITQLVGAEKLIELTSNPALPGFTAPKIVWVRNHEPEVWQKVKKIVLPKDYIRFKLTGELNQEISDAAGMALLDVKHNQWSSELMSILQLQASLFPQLVQSAEIAGYVSSAAAAETGLKMGIPVAGGGADNACAAIGAGVVSAGSGLVSIGTSGVVLSAMDRPHTDSALPAPRTHTFTHAAPNMWYMMSVTQAAGLSLRWARDQIYPAEAAVALQKGVDVYDLITAEAAAIPAGAHSLIFLPYLQGERTPILDSQARGGWIGLTASHSRGDLVRAVLEGVAFSQRQGLDIIEGSGAHIEKMRITGGGARSALWSEILASALGRPLYPLAAEEGPALGAAILAGVAAQIYPSVQSAVDRVVALKDPVLPNAEWQERYAAMLELYGSVYPEIRQTIWKLGQLST